MTKTFQAKHITTRAVLQLVALRWAVRGAVTPMSAIVELAQQYDCDGKIALRALEREVRSNRLDYGTSLNRPFLTDEGRAWLLADTASQTKGAIDV